MKKRLLSLIMAVMMVVVLVVPAAAATTDTNEPATVTVYITEGLFDEGGFANGTPRKQAYIKDGEPDASDWMTQLPFDEEFTPMLLFSESVSENKSIGNFEFYIATSSQSVKLASIKDNGKNTIYIPVSLMSKTAILDFTIKSDSTEQFSVAYSEFDIDGNEKETLTLKESNAGTVSINGSYREQYSFFRYISANNLKWTKTIELSYDGESVEYTVVPFCDVTKLSVTETAGAKNTRPMQLLADGTYTTTVVANSSVKITAGGGIQNVDTTAIDGAGSSVTKTFSGDESLNIRISSKVEGVEAREYTLNVKCIEKDYFPTFVGGTKPRLPVSNLQ